MLRWGIDLLKRDAIVCGVRALALGLSWPDPIRNRASILGVATFSLFYISFMRLVHFAYVALVTGGEVSPSRASRLAVIVATSFGLWGIDQPSPVRRKRRGLGHPGTPVVRPTPVVRVRRLGLDS
jgi:hypothetical protein